MGPISTFPSSSLPCRTPLPHASANARHHIPPPHSNPPQTQLHRGHNHPSASPSHRRSIGQPSTIPPQRITANTFERSSLGPVRTCPSARFVPRKLTVRKANLHDHATIGQMAPRRENQPRQAGSRVPCPNRHGVAPPSTGRSCQRSMPRTSDQSHPQTPHD